MCVNIHEFVHLVAISGPSRDVCRFSEVKGGPLLIPTVSSDSFRIVSHILLYYEAN